MGENVPSRWVGAGKTGVRAVYFSAGQKWLEQVG